MGIHRINTYEVEEFNSPGDLRFRIETDIRLPKGRRARGFHSRLRRAIESSNLEAVRDLLLQQLERPLLRPGDGKPELDRVRQLIQGALSGRAKRRSKGRK